MNMLNKPLISVLIPTHNINSELFKLTFESVIKQDFDNYEIVVNDDCSDQEHFSELTKIVNNHPKVRIIRQETNHGLAYSRDFLIKNANGKYIFFIDDDDLMKPRALSSLAKSIKNDCDIVTAHFQYVFERKNGLYSPIIVNPVKSLSKKLTNIQYYCLNTIYAWGYLIRRDYILENNISYQKEGLTSFEDIPTISQIFLKTHNIVITNYNTIIYRRRLNSISSFNPNQFDNIMSKVIIAYRHNMNQIKQIIADPKYHYKYEDYLVIEQNRYMEYLMFLGAWHHPNRYKEKMMVPNFILNNLRVVHDEIFPHSKLNINKIYYWIITPLVKYIKQALKNTNITME